MQPYIPAVLCSTTIVEALCAGCLENSVLLGLLPSPSSIGKNGVCFNFLLNAFLGLATLAHALSIDLGIDTPVLVLFALLALLFHLCSQRL